MNNKWWTVLMSCVCVCAYAAQAYPAGAAGKACERGVPWLGGSQREARGARGCGRGRPDSCLSEFHLGPRLPPLHFCPLEAAGLWGHCVGRLKGFEGPGEQRGQRPGSTQSAQRGRGRRRARDRLGHSGRDQAWDPRPPSPSRSRRQVLQLYPLPWTCRGPECQPPPHLGPGGPRSLAPIFPKGLVS